MPENTRKTKKSALLIATKSALFAIRFHTVLRATGLDSYSPLPAYRSQLIPRFLVIVFCEPVLHPLLLTFNS
jgi:hypothetical protein